MVSIGTYPTRMPTTRQLTATNPVSCFVGVVVVVCSIKGTVVVVCSLQRNSRGGLLVAVVGVVGSVSVVGVVGSVSVVGLVLVVCSMVGEVVVVSSVLVVVGSVPVVRFVPQAVAKSTKARAGISSSRGVSLNGLLRYVLVLTKNI